MTHHTRVTEESGIHRYRIPAPLEDGGHQIEEPVFGKSAGHSGTDRTFRVMEWIAKRTWHILGLPYEIIDRQGPPSMKVEHREDCFEVTGTVAESGVPLRNQVIAAEVRQMDQPILIYLRGTDAFGEVLIELDLKAGTVRSRSVTVCRSMIGGQSHSSPMPEESSNRIVATGEFPPMKGEWVRLRIRAQGARVVLWADDQEIFRFQDPDPAGGKFGFGSVGTVQVRNVEQWELITPREKARREACIAEIYEFVKDLDAHYDHDVRKKNRIRATKDGVLWTWPATGATVRLRVEGPRVLAVIGAGLYGNDTLVEGVFPEICAEGADGTQYEPDPNGTAKIEFDDLGLRMTLPLAGSNGKKAVAKVIAKFTVQTVWFWTVTVEGANPKSTQAFIGLAPEFAMDEAALKKDPDAMFMVKPQPGKAVLRHNNKAGFYVKAIEPENTFLGGRIGSRGDLGIATTDPALRFATVILPAQPLNLIGFKHRMVHYIRYPEGPNQHWRRRPSFQEYPSNVDLARYRGHGTCAMVWHHTWIGDDYRDREGFLVNEPEMKRAMDETHRLGMKAIGYLGIVPGRNSLLRFEDTVPLSGQAAYGGYDKNWDLQDFTFYHVNGRYPEFLAWLTDHLCKEYELDGYYLDGGSFGSSSRGAFNGPLHPEDAHLSLEEIRHRAYYRIRKVLELNRAGYGLEPWSGLDWMINGFYDCMMIGESFQEADPEYYRNGHNALLTGCTVKMYGMRETSQNPYNIAMAAINLSDIQVCSGNGAWGDVADTTDTWKRVGPLWRILESIDWDYLVEARPWYAQELVAGEGFYAGNYTEQHRAIVFLANRTEEPGTFQVHIDPAKLPEIEGKWHMRYCLGRTGDIGPLGDGTFEVDLPALHDGPIGIELITCDL